jgi:hypothetical protein
VHEPEELAVVTVMVRAAIVVLEVFDAVPLTVTQAPLASELTAWVTVLEKVVVGVQLTVVWPEVALWTSMLAPLMEATLPEAPMFEGEAAPAVEATAVAARSAVTPVPARRIRRRRVPLRLVNDCIVRIPLSGSRGVG